MGGRGFICPPPLEGKKEGDYFSHFRKLCGGKVKEFEGGRDKAPHLKNVYSRVFVHLYKSQFDATKINKQTHNNVLSFRFRASITRCPPSSGKRDLMEWQSYCRGGSSAK